MNNSTVARQQRMVLRSRRNAAKTTATDSRVAHGNRVAGNHHEHGHGQGLADQMRAERVTATGHEAVSRPGWRTAFWGFLAGAVAIKLWQNFQHVPGSWAAAIGGGIVVGGLVWLAAYGLILVRHHLSVAPRASSRRLSPQIGCGDPRCMLEPCATYLLPSPTAKAPDRDDKRSGVGRVAKKLSPVKSDAVPLEVLHRAAPACPDCIASTRVDKHQPPGMVALITAHQATCPYYENLVDSASVNTTGY